MHGRLYKSFYFSHIPSKYICIRSAFGSIRITNTLLTLQIVNVAALTNEIALSPYISKPKSIYLIYINIIYTCMHI